MQCVSRNKSRMITNCSSYLRQNWSPWSHLHSNPLKAAATLLCTYLWPPWQQIRTQIIPYQIHCGYVVVWLYQYCRIKIFWLCVCWCIYVFFLLCLDCSMFSSLVIAVFDELSQECLASWKSLYLKLMSSAAYSNAISTQQTSLTHVGSLAEFETTYSRIVLA